MTSFDGSDLERVRPLLDAVMSVGADLSLDGVLSRIVEVASDLAGARYAALGVLGDPASRRLRTFVHRGISPEQAVEIGELPHGHGLLGLIIDRPEPLRLRDIAAHPASYGFPAHHPPMGSFLGVPVRTRERVFGNLYLTEKAGGGDFTAADEEVVVALAAAAGVAIDHARLYAQAADRERWLAATAETTRRIGSDLDEDDALRLVAERARRAARADAVRVVVGGRSAVVGADLTPTLEVPLGPDGTLGLAWTTDPVEPVDPRLPAAYAEQAALVLEVARARADRERLLVLQDRDRIGRDLHDLVIQRLFAVGLGLDRASRRATDPDLAGRLSTAVDDLDDTIRDIRRTIFALGSTDEVEGDLQTEVTRLVERAAATLKFRPTLHVEGPVRTLVGADLAPDLLAVLAEALSNAARHADARSVTVELVAGREVVLTVRDDGRGVPEGAAHSGLRNLRERALRHGGTCSVTSAPGAGTTLVWAVPVGGTKVP